LSTTVGNIGQSVSSLTSNLDITGKAAQFATAFSNPTSAITNLASTDVTALASGALDSATAAATGAVTTATAAVTSAVNNAVDSVNNQITNVTDKLGSLSNLSLDSLKDIFGGGAGDLVAKVQTAAGFTNTTNRGTLDVAFVKILGSSKIPLPSFEAPSANSLSLSSIADISSAATILQNLKSQGGALLSQVSQAQKTVTGLVTQAQNTASGVSTQAGGVISNALNQAGRRIG
jgi:phage-related protein